MEGEKKSSSLSDVGAWAMNVVSSVGIIMANKQLMSANGYGFSFATTLTGFHFGATALVGMVSNATGYSASKHVPLWELLWFSIVANMSITGMNLSLMLNSVGFYQISKLSMIPVVCVMEWILHNKHYTREVKMAVVVVVIGVGVCTVTDVKVNAKGFLCACVAVLSTSLQQISIGSLQKKYSIGSFELLSKTAPIQALSLLVLGPFVDYYLSGNIVLNYMKKISSGAILFILLSCSLAVFCNVSQYLCIGRFSAVSFQVLGHMKTVCVLTLGWLLFDSTLTFKNIMGMLVAVIGMVIYSWAVELEKLSNSKITPHTKNSLTEEEIRLLRDGVEHAPLKSIGSLQKKYSIGSFELLSKTAPIQALSLLVLGPFVDYYLSGNIVLNYMKKISSGAILFILLSCSLAVFCNVSQYLCIGRFSAVSFQVLGHMKTVCVLTLGWLLFDSTLTFKNIMGMLVAVIGMVIYSWAVELEKLSNSKITPHTKNSLTEEEIRLLRDGVEHAPLKSIGSLQKKYSIGSFELLSKTAPIQALSLLVLGPFVDYYLSGNIVLNYMKKISSGAILFILLSCSLAVFCNVSQYLCIGRFSAVSFQVLGHMKTVCVLTLGWLLFDSTLTFKNIMGMLVAVIGMVIYSWAVELEKLSNSKITPHTKNSLTEEEIRLLRDGVEHAPLKVRDIELGESKV